MTATKGTKRLASVRLVAFVVVMLVLLSAAYALMPADLFRSGSPAPHAKQYPLCADARDQKITTTTTIRVRSDCWSGWVKLTPGTEFDLLFSDETELFYRGGGRRTLPKSVGSLGHTPSTFSIRGKGGTVTVRLHDE